MTRRVEVTVTFTSTWEYDESMSDGVGKILDDDAARSYVKSIIGDYIASPEGTMYADYGPHAWGGWSGPTYIEGSVS